MKKTITKLAFKTNNSKRISTEASQNVLINEEIYGIESAMLND